MLFHKANLHQLRADASPLFRQWDIHISTGEATKAKILRREQLWPMVREKLESAALDRPGIYMFADNTGSSGWASINYIGQTNRSLRQRLDHYVKEDSCWDEQILKDDTSLSTIAFSRLRPVMPSTDETLSKHVRKHEIALRKVRGCSLFIAGFDDRDANMILPVEAAFIAIAWTYGAPLENDKIDRLPRLSNRGRALELCSQMISGWKNVGLNEELYQQVQSALSSRTV